MKTKNRVQEEGIRSREAMPLRQFSGAAIQTVRCLQFGVQAAKAQSVARVIRLGHPAKRDQQVTCAMRSRWRATPGSDDPGHSTDGKQAHFVDRLQSKSQFLEPSLTVGLLTESSALMCR